MTEAKQTTHFRFWLRLIRIIGVIVPRRLAAEVGADFKSSNTGTPSVRSSISLDRMSA